MPRPLRAAAALALLVLLGGCSTVRVTDPARTATEQFLLSRASARAVYRLSAEALRDRRVFVDPTYLEVIDEPFILGQVRSHLLHAGVRLVPDRAQAEVVLEVRSGGVGIDRYESLLGLPAFAVPSAATGTTGTGAPTLVTPEIAILKNIKQFGVAEIAYVAYWADTGELLASSGPYVGRTERKDFWFFGFGPRTVGNIPPAETPE